jgi:hypothetical protein
MRGKELKSRHLHLRQGFMRSVWQVRRTGYLSDNTGIDSPMERRDIRMPVYCILFQVLFTQLVVNKYFIVYIPCGV